MRGAGGWGGTPPPPPRVVCVFFPHQGCGNGFKPQNRFLHIITFTTVCLQMARCGVQHFKNKRHTLKHLDVFKIVVQRPTCHGFPTFFGPYNLMVSGDHFLKQSINSFDVAIGCHTLPHIFKIVVQHRKRHGCPRCLRAYNILLSDESLSGTHPTHQTQHNA